MSKHKSVFYGLSFIFCLALVSLVSVKETHAAYPSGNETVLYHFENNGSTIVNSGSGGSTYDSAFSGAAAYVATNTTPFGNYAATFDTDSDYVDTKFGNGVNPTTNPISVSLWVNQQTACSADRHIFGYGASGVGTRFYIRCLASDGKWNYRLGAQASATSVGSAVALNRWYHLALVTQGTNVRFYVNGVNQGTTTVASYAIGGNLYVGTINATLNQGSGAIIDEVAIYNNRSLTDAEVAEIYTAGASVLINATSTTATEGGATGSYKVSLKTAPTANVTVNISSDSQATTSASSLTFTTANWFTPQTVTVTATDDASVEGSHTATISHTTSSSDSNYNSLTVNSVTATITDNDVDSAPTISNVSSDKANGYYAAGDVIDIDLTFSEAVTATTSVTVTLETGTTDRTCTFTASNSSTASCNYTVQAGDVTSDLTVSSVSGYIEDQTGNPMTNFTPSTNLAANKAIAIGEYLSFVSPTPSANSTTTDTTITVYASSTMFTSATSTTTFLSLETPAGSVVSSVSTSTRYGDYNLTHMTQTGSVTDLSALTANASGLAFVPTTRTLFVVHNSSNVISEISTTTGAVVRTITCSSCGDIEGITLVSSVASSTAPGVYDHTFMISTEDTISNLAVFRVVIPSTGSVTVNNTNSFSTGITTASSNLGLEGIAYDSERDIYYLAREKTPALFQYAQGGTGSQICSNLNFSSIATDFSDIAYVASNKTLYVLSDENSRVIPVDITSTSTCAFVDSDGDSNTTNDTGDYLNSIPYTVGGTTDDQTEGIAWDETGDYLYLMGEDHDFTRYRTNAYTVRHTFSGLSDGSYVLRASSTDATTGLTARAPARSIGITTVDSTAPTITNVTSDKANGSYSTGTVIDIDVTFSEAVTSTGNVTVTLETGSTDRTCTFSVSNSTSGTCNYTVQAGDTSSDLTVSSISGTIADQSANAMTNFVPSTNLAANKALVIDTASPLISSVATSSITTTTAIISWTTDETSTSTVEYGTTSSYGSASSSASSVTTHSITLTGLSADTTYHFRVSSGDAANNYSTSTDYTFTTLAVPDTTAPSITNIATSTTGTTATITWDTDESATSTVEYGTTSSYGSASSSSTFTEDHSITITGLSNGTTYHFRISSGDASFNYSTTTDMTFTTAADTGAPVISGVDVDPDEDSATFTWTTDELGSSMIAYGVSASLGATTTEADLSPRVLSHSVTVSDLVSCTRYFFRIASRDAAGNTGYNDIAGFTTEGCTGSADIEEEETEVVSVSTGGDIELAFEDQEIELQIPADVASTTSSLVFQIKTITDNDVISSIESPSGKVVVDGHVYDLKAYLNATSTQSSFDEPITIILTYSDEDAQDIDEATLRIYRYDGSAWVELDECVVDTSANTVTCETDHFSVFGLFGQEVSSGSGGGTRNRRPVALSPTATAPTPTSTAVTQSAPAIGSITKSLFLGMTDPEVIILQKLLNLDPATQIAQSGAGSPGFETSYFGALTKAAVIKFQLKHGLISSAGEPFAGFVGPQTRAKLNSLSAAPSLPFTLPFVPSPTPNNQTSGSITKSLFFGMTDSEVVTLQKKLNVDPETAVASAGAGSKGFESQYFGTRTKAAVIKFQLKHKLISSPAEPVAGYVGPATRAKLNEILAN